MAEETKETKRKLSRKEKKAAKKEAKKSKKKRGLLPKVCFIFLVLVVVGWFTVGTKIMRLHKEATQLVANATEDTFRSSQTSIVYDKSGKQLTKFRGEKDAYYLKYKKIPIYAVGAMVSVEDRNFYQHKGVDFFGIARAAVSFVVKRGTVTQGGSTITQQLARTVFLNREISWQRKAKEIFVALELEKKYSKTDILEFYLNNVYFANGYYGIEAASEGYFNKDAQNLTMSEAAFLCAIPNAPTMYDPRLHEDKTIVRRDKILKDMLEQNIITKDQYADAMAEKIVVRKAKNSARKDYVETYVVHCATKALMKKQGFEFQTSFDSDKERKKYSDEYNRTYVECNRLLYSKGYHIYTSIDPKIQKKLQKSINDELKDYKTKDKNGYYRTQAAGTCIDNETGRVVAIVGGRQQKNTGYTLNRAYQSPRQPGSSIKPLLVYAPILERGYGPGSTVNDNPMSTKDKHHVRNSGSYSGMISLRRAVEKSSNVATMRLYEELTPSVALRYLEKMNFKYLKGSDYRYYTTCLGGFTQGTTTEEMAAGFATLENDGVYREPTCITKITTASGDEVMSSSRAKRTVYTESAASQMTSVLQSVVNNGTGKGAKIPNVDTAGKTGTTSSNRDGWFCGYTPYYTTSIWVGRDDNKVMEELSGGSFPKEIWTGFMKTVHSQYQQSNDNNNGGYDTGESYSTRSTRERSSTTTEGERKETTTTAEATAEQTTAAPTTSAPTTSAPTTAAPTTAAPSPSP